MKPRRSASSSIGEISDEEALNMEVNVPDHVVKSDRDHAPPNKQTSFGDQDFNNKYLQHMSSLPPESDRIPLQNQNTFEQKADEVVKAEVPMSEPANTSPHETPGYEEERSSFKDFDRTENSMKNALEQQIEDVKKKLQEEIELEALKMEAEKKQQINQFKAICDETKSKYQHIFEKIQEAEEKTFGAEDRTSITDAVQLNDTDTLYDKFNQ